MKKILQSTQTTKESLPGTYSFGVCIKSNHFTIQDTGSDMRPEAVSYAWSIVTIISGSTIHMRVVIATTKT